MMEAKLEEYNNTITILEKASLELENQITQLSERFHGNELPLQAQIEVARTTAEQHAQDLARFRESRNIISAKLERAKNSLEFVSDRIHLLQNRNQECSICMERKCSIIIPCGHLFCSQCIRKHLKISNKCPECREMFTENTIRGVTLGGIGTKMLQIANLIESIGDSIILFVQWKSMLRGMKSFLRGMNIKVLTLEGNVSQRASTLADFTLGGVLLLCLEDSFAGLHLPHAHHVIFSHAIVGDVRNVSLLEQQAIARCVRHGQKEQVKVYSFVVKDCDEEVVWNNTHDTGTLKE
jgi:SNF2 family DNA or RNA helicase